MKLFRTLQKVALGAFLPLFLLGASVQAQTTQETDPPRPAVKEYNLEKGLALSGFDPVAYFPEGGGKARKGKKDLTVTHRGVTYRFASEKNKSLFEKKPARFEPAYGGWCAYAMSQGKKFEVDPESFLIENGRLHVFYKGLFNNTKKKWTKEGGDKLRPKADASWKKISGEGDKE